MQAFHPHGYVFHVAYRIKKIFIITLYEPRTLWGCELAQSERERLQIRGERWPYFLNEGQEESEARNRANNVERYTDFPAQQGYGHMAMHGDRPMIRQVIIMRGSPHWST
jgi:hypothetical protein